MQGQSYQAKTVLEQLDTKNKTFLVLKDSPGNPLGRQPTVYNVNYVKCLRSVAHWGYIRQVLRVFDTKLFQVN